MGMKSEFHIKEKTTSKGSLVISDLAVTWSMQKRAMRHRACNSACEPRFSTKGSSPDLLQEPCQASR